MYYFCRCHNALHTAVLPYMPCTQRATLCAQEVRFDSNNATSADATSGFGGALFVVPDCSGGFGCKTVSANMTDFSMTGNAAGQVSRPNLPLGSFRAPYRAYTACEAMQ